MRSRRVRPPARPEAAEAAGAAAAGARAQRAEEPEQRHRRVSAAPSAAVARRVASIPGRAGSPRLCSLCPGFSEPLGSGAPAPRAASPLCAWRARPGAAGVRFQAPRRGGAGRGRVPQPRAEPQRDPAGQAVLPVGLGHRVRPRHASCFVPHGRAGGGASRHREEGGPPALIHLSGASSALEWLHLHH